MISRLIKNDEDYEKVLSRIDDLMDAEPGTTELDELELLTTLVEMYEEEHFPINIPDPVDAIKFRMEQQNLSQKDLVPFIGTKSKVSEILNRKRQLTLSMMRGLHEGLGIPAEVLLNKPGGQFPETIQNIEWSKFPVMEMAKRGWLEMVDGIKEKAEEVMHPFVQECGGLDSLRATMFRQGISGRLNAKTDRYAIMAWCLRGIALARNIDIESSFNQSSITKTFLSEIVKLSYFKDGPLLAREYLEKQGIHLLIVPHLSKTVIDGGVILLPDGNAAVVLSLGHDRLDNFWFTLLHELAHLMKHLNEKCRYFVDDLDLRGKDEPDHGDYEEEADDIASTALIPKKYWEILDEGKPLKPSEVNSLASRLKIHPSIIAGRIRFKHKNYKLLQKLIGRDQVRKMFPEFSNEISTV